MYDKVVIKQPAGLGDIFFCLKIAYTFHKGFNCDVIWPVIPQYEWIKDYINYPFIHFINQEEDYPLKNKINQTLFPQTSLLPDIRVLELEENDKQYILVPLQHADWVSPGISVMDAKYKFVNLDLDDWQEFFEFERNIEKENKLYYEVLGLTDESEYVFVNKQFGSPPDTQTCSYIDVSKFSNYVEMSYLEDYSLFDWCKVIENAKEIHTVETSLNFIIDKINPKGKLEMYSKHNPPSYNHVQHLFKANWNYNGQ